MTVLTATYPNLTGRQATHEQAIAGSLSNVGALPGLLRSLKTLGCTVTGAEDYMRVVRTAPESNLPMPVRVLGMSKEELAKDLESYAVTETGKRAARSRYQQLRRQADQELVELLASELDAHLETLRPLFDAAAAEARAINNFGIEPTDGPEQVMVRGGKASEYWISFTQGSDSLATLETIASIRASLAEVTNSGEGQGADHTVGLLNPYTPEVLTMRRGEPRYVPWLRAAESLELVPFAKLDPGHIIQAQGYNLDQFKTSKEVNKQ